jgi:hypothetical protein
VVRAAPLHPSFRFIFKIHQSVKSFSLSLIPDPLNSAKNSLRHFALAALAIAAGLPTASACSVCGCSLSSDWAAQGYPAMSGLEAGMRYEYFEQSDLRSGTDGVNRAALKFPNDDEIQQRTVNRNTWLELNYVADATWAVSAQIPYHDRFHTTIAAGDTAISTSDATGPGDVRVLGRYQQFGVTRSFGLQFGLKLPTGRFDQEFAAGPQAGEPLDRGLQLGTGTTDLLLGASWFTLPMPNLGGFTQLTFQQPLAARAGFIPSSSVTVSGGLRWLNASSFTPQLQLNVKSEGREHGTQADTPNSGSTLAYLSPGLTTELGTRATGYVFVQLPVYQRVNGLQLEPKWLLSLGLHLRL